MSPDKGRLGKCYELAGLRMMDEEDDAVLVHGTIGPNKNPHAWIESDDGGFSDMEDPGSVWEPASDKVWPRPVFYAIFYAMAHYSYDHVRFRKQALQTENWGPWEGTYWKKIGKVIEAR